MIGLACFGLIGIVMLFLGIYIRVGGFKTWYLVRGTPIVMPQALRNMLIPLGISITVLMILVSGLIPVPRMETRRALLGCTFIMFVVSMILGVWNPRWLRPRWLVYLEDEYGTLMWRLLKEAAKNPREWERRVRTQEGLEEWAREVAGEPRPRASAD